MRSSAVVRPRSGDTSHAARTRHAATRRSRTTPALWANSVMGSTRTTTPWLNVDFRGFHSPLRNCPRARRSACPETKRSLLQCVGNKGGDGLDQSQLQIYVVPALGLQRAFRTSCVTQRVISQRSCLGGFFVMESKRAIDQLRNPRMPPDRLLSWSPAPHYGICP
jgi:hypothetical protein